MKCHKPEFVAVKPSRKIESPEDHAIFSDILIDYLSGREIPFSNRENIRQKLVKTLVEEKGYQNGDISLDREIRFEMEGRPACSLVDLALGFGGVTLMVFKCAAGSVVSRERQIIATARLLEDYIIPYAVVTNGVNIELLDTLTEKVIGEGIGPVPTRLELFEKSKDLTLKPTNKKKLIYEQSVLYTYDSICCALYSEGQLHPQPK
jgi:hypothetical protein